jgi:hypothetical protein
VNVWNFSSIEMILDCQICRGASMPCPHLLYNSCQNCLSELRE